jgi:hypothetical protein
LDRAVAVGSSQDERAILLDSGEYDGDTETRWLMR